MKRPHDVSAATHIPGRLPVKEVCGLRHYSIKPENVTIVAICNFRDKEIDVFFPLIRTWEWIFFLLLLNGCGLFPSQCFHRNALKHAWNIIWFQTLKSQKEHAWLSIVLLFLETEPNTHFQEVNAIIYLLLASKTMYLLSILKMTQCQGTASMW